VKVGDDILKQIDDSLIGDLDFQEIQIKEVELT